MLQWSGAQWNAVELHVYVFSSIHLPIPTWKTQYTTFFRLKLMGIKSNLFSRYWTYQSTYPCFYLFIYFPIYPSIYLCIFVYLYLPIYLSIYPLYLHLCLYLFVSMSISIFVFKSIARLYLSMPIYLSYLCPSINPPIHLSICLSIYLSI